MMKLFDLSGKTVLVTGANRGLGKAMALALAEAGADVAALSRRPALETRDEIEKLGRRVHLLTADLSSARDWGAVVNECVREFGALDILVNNAGIIRREDSVRFSEEDWDEVMNVNLKSLFFLSQKAALRFIEQGRGGKIINIASMLSFQGGIRVPSYTASKSGVLGLTRLLACEWAAHNIQVNGIAPGYMATDNTQALREDKDRSKAILDRIPAGRWGKPEDMAGPVVFLASPASDYMNGYTIAVDGGWLAR